MPEQLEPYVTRKRARRRGKELERVCAARLGGKRLGVTGLATADVEVGLWSIEAKSRKVLPALIRDAMAQAVRNAPAGKVPICIFHVLSTRHSNDIVAMRFSDFEEWFGKISIPDGEEDDVTSE